jgi:hypothetical protein
MNRYEKVAWVFPALADASPFIYYALIIQVWRNVPWAVVVGCSVAPPVIGVAVLIILPILKYRTVIPRRSDGALIGTTLAVVGILEPVFYMFY